jgi:hypothetical protein
MNWAKMSNKIHTEWKSSGNSVVDMVASAVSHYRKIMKPLKTIRLHAMFYSNFEFWVSKQMSEEQFLEAREHGFQFDGVNVEMAHKFQTSNMAFEFYDSNGE